MTDNFDDAETSAADGPNKTDEAQRPSVRYLYEKWKEDPTWDLPETPGYEAVRDSLLELEARHDELESAIAIQRDAEAELQRLESRRLKLQVTLLALEGLEQELAQAVDALVEEAQAVFDQHEPPR